MEHVRVGSRLLLVLTVKMHFCTAAAIAKIEMAMRRQNEIFDLLDILRFHTIVIGHKASITSVNALKAIKKG